LAKTRLLFGEKIEKHDRRRRLGRQLLHSRLGRMQSHLQGIELETFVADDDDLAVEDAALWQLRLQRWNKLREVAIERSLVATLDVDLVAIAEEERAEAVPLRLEDPAFAGRQLADSLGQHWQ